MVHVAFGTVGYKYRWNTKKITCFKEYDVAIGPGERVSLK